ncbi:MAG TPA: tRNA modification GTPase, partial [Salinimicrobium sp.]|nr:tRNA modification GTPase [Salinimicrobium sp.]
MKKHLLLLLIAISTVNCFAQITFEQGYYINNSGQMINGLIKNNDWRSNPEEFEFKRSESDDSQTLRIENVREFGVDDKFKFIRETVQIDRSSDNISNLSESRKPVFDTEELFLKVLVEGKADLFQYQNGNLKRYFFRIDDSEVEQLIYKNYRTSKGKIGTNNRFRQQLWNGLECETIARNKIGKTEYNENDLVKVFVQFNSCENADIVNFANNQKRDLLNINIRPRLTSSSLTVQSISNNREIELGNKQSIGVGVEAEFILPFNRNKWAVSLEP